MNRESYNHIVMDAMQTQQADAVLIGRPNDIVTGDALQANEVAQAQFVRNLVRQAEKEAKDEALYARWKQRQPELKRIDNRERKLIAAGYGAALLVGGISAAAAVVWLVSLGVTALALLAVAALLAGSSGCGCTVIVTHVCGH